MRYIIYGPPGTGKTHTLLGHIESFLESTPPDQIGYFTFSKNAAGEGKQRACLLYTSPSPRDRQKSRMPSSA